MNLFILFILASSASYVALGQNSTVNNNITSNATAVVANASSIIVATASNEVVATYSTAQINANQSSSVSSSLQQSTSQVEESSIAPSPTVTASVAATSIAPETKKKVKLTAQTTFQLTKAWNNDLKNESSSAYKELTKDLEKALESSLKVKTTIKEASYSSGSIICNITAEFEEELETSDAVPSDIIVLFKKVIQSAELGNFTVNSTYIIIQELLDPAITVTTYKVNDDECKEKCCSGGGILNLEITQYRTCTGDEKKCESVITKRKVLCEDFPCCSSASDLLLSPLTILLAVALVFFITG